MIKDDEEYNVYMIKIICVFILWESIKIIKITRGGNRNSSGSGALYCCV